MQFEENELGVYIIILYVDEMLIIGKGTDTRVCHQKTKRFLCEDPTQPSRLFGLSVPHEYSENKRIAGTTLYNQEFGKIVW